MMARPENPPTGDSRHFRRNQKIIPKNTSWSSGKNKSEAEYSPTCSERSLTGWRQKMATKYLLIGANCASSWKKDVSSTCWPRINCQKWGSSSVFTSPVTRASLSRSVSLKDWEMSLKNTELSLGSTCIEEDKLGTSSRLKWLQERLWRLLERWQGSTCPSSASDQSNSPSVKISHCSLWSKNLCLRRWPKCKNNMRWEWNSMTNISVWLCTSSMPVLEERWRYIYTKCSMSWSSYLWEVLTYVTSTKLSERKLGTCLFSRKPWKTLAVRLF